MLWSDLCCNTEKSLEILAYIELLYNLRVNKVFTHSYSSLQRKVLGDSSCRRLPCSVMSPFMMLTLFVFL